MEQPNCRSWAVGAHRKLRCSSCAGTAVQPAVGVDVAGSCAGPVASQPSPIPWERPSSSAQEPFMELSSPSPFGIRGMCLPSLSCMKILVCGSQGQEPSFVCLEQGNYIVEPGCFTGTSRKVVSEAGGDVTSIFWHQARSGICSSAPRARDLLTSPVARRRS